MKCQSNPMISCLAGAVLLLNPAAAAAGPDHKICTDRSPRPHLRADVSALYPEGIEVNPLTGRFLLGSVRRGGVFEISAEGKGRQIINDDRLRSVIGIRVDAKRNRLFAVSSDFGASTRSQPADKFSHAALGIYDLESGRPIKFVDLSALRPNNKRFANDVAIDDAGNAYVTDSIAAAIYKVTPEGTATTFLTSETFHGKGFNLNGIVVHPDGYLLVAKKSDGQLFKVPLENPKSFAAVRMPKALKAADGLVLATPNELVVITNQAGKTKSDTVFTLKSEDSWTSAEVTGSSRTGDVYATTGVIKDRKLFVNYGRLNTLVGSLKAPGQYPLLNSFTIHEVAEIY